MTEKVLGFWKKDAKFNSTLGWVLVEEDKLVPVRLASASVDLKALKDELLKHINCKDYHKLNEEKATCLDMVINWAEKEAKK